MSELKDIINFIQALTVCASVSEFA